MLDCIILKNHLLLGNVDSYWIILFVIAWDSQLQIICIFHIFLKIIVGVVHSTLARGILANRYYVVFELCKYSINWIQSCFEIFLWQVNTSTIWWIKHNLSIRGDLNSLISNFEIWSFNSKFIICLKLCKRTSLWCFCPAIFIKSTKLKMTNLRRIRAHPKWNYFIWDDIFLN